MKILSVRQPWASLIAQGIKTIENRSWATPYRGPVMIHASKAAPTEDILLYTQRILRATGRELPAQLPTGGIVGIVDLTACLTESAEPWFSGPYGWLLENPQTLPFWPLPGRLGLFNPPPKVHAWVLPMRNMKRRKNLA
jgi:hypothetical protein